MKKVILSALLTTLALTATAEQRSVEEMRNIAATQLHKQNTTANSRRITAKDASAQLVRLTDAYAVFEPAQGEGFVIVNRDDAARPILGYSSTAFPANDMPDGLQWFLTQAEQQHKRGTARRNAATFTPKENFVTTKWSQDYPFNKLTPNNFPTGCVATALAQGLNYCQWPASASFEGTCSVTTKVGRKEKTEQQTLTINSTYTWPYSDTYKSMGRINDNIDELLRDCGYATNMHYSADGSGSFLLMSGMALTHYFNYPEESVKYLEREYSGSQDEWAQTIYDEIGRDYPVLYGAYDDTYGGHAFLLSGIDADGLVYINWGWRGNADGFFDLADLNPVESGDQLHLNTTPEIVYGLHKEPLPTDRIEVHVECYADTTYTFSWRTMKDEDSIAHNTLYIKLPYGFINYHPTDFKGVFGIFADDLTDGSTWVIDPILQDRDTLPSGYSYGASYEDFAFYYFVDCNNGLQPGHSYRMSFGYCDDREDVWHSIFCQGKELAYEVTYTGDPATSTVAATPTTPPVLTGIRSLQNNGNNRRYTKTSLITRVYDSNGRLVHTAPTSSFNLWDVPKRGILIVDDGQTRRKVVR